MFRRLVTTVLIGTVLLIAGCTNKKVQNPIANINSKQPDKVLYDRAMEAMKHGKYDVARLSLQTLINTYPDSEYVARAKLAVGDSWYAEGGSAAMAQAESEYKDFETFFPNMPEAAEAQLKIANIHYKEMEKADRDYTHAKRAEEEYRQLILQYPDSKLVPEAKQKLLQVQEVLARREYMIGHFYYERESWPAAIARLKSVADTYPLYSGSDQALYELGGAYEREIDLLRASKLPEAAKGTMIKKYTDDAAAAYDRILTRYPMEERAPDAKKRLEALKRPVPKATPEAIAQNKAEIASRGSLGMTGKLMENFKHEPDISEATKVGEPTLVDPKQASAPEMVRSFSTDVRGALGMGSTKDATVQRLTGGKGAPDANAPVPRSDAAPGTTDAAASTATTAAGDSTASATATPAAGDPPPAAAPPASAGGPLNGAAASGTTNNDATSDLKNDLSPAAATPPPGSSAAQAPAPPLPPTQVNDAANSTSTSGSTAQPAASSADGTQTAPPADPNSESSSKKKKKHHFPF